MPAISGPRRARRRTEDAVSVITTYRLGDPHGPYLSTGYEPPVDMSLCEDHAEMVRRDRRILSLGQSTEGIVCQICSYSTVIPTVR